MAIDRKIQGLVADIGGTNGRFALVRQKDGKLCDQRHYLCADFASFEAMVQRYLRDSEQNEPMAAVIAIAGPVHDNRCAMTGGDWVVDGQQLQTNGVFSSCHLLNDFAALAYALPLLQGADLVQIGGHDAPKEGARLVVGPGTGLGAAFLAKMDTSFHVVEGEGGHMSFAPVDEVESELLSWFGRKYGRVSVERFLSGSGLEDLHLALAEIEGRPIDRHSGRPLDHLGAAKIMTLGLQNEGCERDTLLRFCAILGSFAGDMALASGCWGRCLYWRRHRSAHARSAEDKLVSAPL